VDTLLGTLFPDFTYLQTSLFWCKSLEIIMRILTAVLLIGVTSEAWTTISFDDEVYYCIGDSQHVPTLL